MIQKVFIVHFDPVYHISESENLMTLFNKYGGISSCNLEEALGNVAALECNHWSSH